jgi:large conductance mechanosensitive channel
MGFIKEFKEFALKGNMIDLAIGVVIGTAFNKVVSSLVSDIIMPLFGLFAGFGDFSNLSLTIPTAIGLQKPIEIKYGLFINTMIDFIIISFAIFIVIKFMNKLKQEKTPDLKIQKCPECLLDIPLKAKKCGFCCSELK